MQTPKPKIAAVYGVLSAAWIGVLFFFSGQSGEESGRLSERLTRWLFGAFIERGADAAQLEHLLRKAAHFSIFAVAGFLICMTLLHLLRRRGVKTHAPRHVERADFKIQPETVGRGLPRGTEPRPKMVAVERLVARKARVPPNARHRALGTRVERVVHVQNRIRNRRGQRTHRVANAVVKARAVCLEKRFFVVLRELEEKRARVRRETFKCHRCTLRFVECT